MDSTGSPTGARNSFNTHTHTNSHLLLTQLLLMENAQIGIIKHHCVLSPALLNSKVGGAWERARSFKDASFSCVFLITAGELRPLSALKLHTAWTEVILPFPYRARAPHHFPSVGAPELRESTPGADGTALPLASQN